MKDTIIIWTSDPPEGYSAFESQDEPDEISDDIQEHISNRGNNLRYRDDGGSEQ